MKCYASDYCQKDKSSCSDVCGGYRVLRALYNLSRIPERYRYTIALKPENGEDLEAFTKLDNYKNDVLSMVDEGRGLYIWGKSTGNGKTSWACKIMSYFFRKIAFNTGLENEGLYIFLPTFLEDLRDNYDNKDPEFDEVLRMIKTCRLLIIDDIGAERVTDWVRERMVSIINTRVSNNLTTIYTSNLSPEELRGELGDEAPKYFSEDPDKGGRLYHITKAGCDLMAGRIIGAQSEAFKTKYAPVFGEEAPVEVVEEKQEEPQEKAYTVEEVAQILGCSERNVYRNIQSGKLEAVEREVMIPTLKKFVTEEALEKYKAGRAS